MDLVETRYSHIVLGSDQAPRIANTTMKVVELVAAQQAHGWSPEELVFQFPHLTLGEVYSALAYYWDNRAELDRDMASRSALADTLQRHTPPAPILARLQSQRPDAEPTDGRGRDVAG